MTAVNYISPSRYWYC